MTVKEFWESSDKLAIQCRTEKEAVRLLDKFNELGKKWHTGRATYVAARRYDFGSNTCYSNNGAYGSKGCLLKYAYTILKFSDLDDFKSEPVCKSLILDDVEFDYLWGVIKPFKDRVESIMKVEIDGGHKNFISISVGKDKELITLPYFLTESSMYKGMEANKRYTLAELGFIKPKPKLNCRAVCVESDFCGLTVGRIYEFRDGYLTFDRGYKSAFNQSVEEFNDNNPHWKLLQIKED